MQHNEKRYLNKIEVRDPAVKRRGFLSLSRLTGRKLLMGRTRQFRRAEGSKRREDATWLLPQPARREPPQRTGSPRKGLHPQGASRPASAHFRASSPLVNLGENYSVDRFLFLSLN